MTTSVHLLDPEQLQLSMAYLAGALPCRVKGLILETRDGDVIGQMLARDDGGQVARLVRDTHRHAAGLASQMGNGSVRYHVSVCRHGAALTLLLGDAYLLCINLADLKSLDQVLSAVQEGLPPLLDVLGLS